MAVIRTQQRARGDACARSRFHPLDQARANNYPTRPVTIIVSLAAGTGMDTLVRLYADKLSQSLGQPMVIDNRPGGAGVVAGETHRQGRARRLHAGGGDQRHHGDQADAVQATPVQSADRLRADLQLRQVAVRVHRQSVAADQTVAGIHQICQGAAGPDQLQLSGIGGAPHLTAELLKQKFGFEMAHVPYRNSPQSIADVAAGHVQASIAEAGASLPLIKDGKLRAIAVTSATRFPSLPDVPPIAEAVGMPDLEAVSWHVLFARHDTPREIVDKLARRDEAHHGGAGDAAEDLNIGLIPHESPSVEGLQQLHQGGDRQMGRAGAQAGPGGLAVGSR